MIKIECCKICNSTYQLESHHIIFRSQSKALINCKINQVYLCHSCHQHLHNHPKGFETDYQLKIDYQNYMEMVFDGQAFTLEEIQEVLQISYKAIYGLSKLMKLDKGKYTRESIIIALCGGESAEQRYKKRKIKEKG